MDSMLKRVEPQFSPLLLLKSGNSSRPIFFAPGLASPAEGLRDLAERMETDGSIYGLQFDGLNKVKADCSMEEIARFYLGAIREIQPKGPYFFIGYSFGGLVVLELSNQITAGGEKTALITLIDTYPHLQYWPLKQWLLFFGRRAIRHARTTLSLSAVEAPTYALQRLLLFWERLRERRGLVPNDRSLLHAGSEAENLSAKNYFQRASAAYHPRQFGTRITLLRSQDGLVGNDRSALAIWGKWTKDVAFYSVPGDHLGAVQTPAQIESVARQLSLRIKNAEVGIR
jgi:acetoacetyl-CoA synthetase